MMRKTNKIFAFVMAFILAMNLYSFNAKAAQVTIDSSVNQAESFFGVNNVVFITTDIGYVFYRDASGSCVYSKTLNGGSVWGNAVTIDSQVDCLKISVWYDQWTPGDTSGTYIYTGTIDSSADDIWYNRLDTATDTLLMGSSPVSITTDKTNTYSVTATGNIPTIIKATDGDIFLGSHDGGNGSDESTIKKCSASCNLSANWSDAGTLGLDISSANNPLMLVPLSSGNILAISYDQAPNDLQSKVYTDASGTWDASWTIIDTNATVNNTYDLHMGFGINKATGAIYLGYATSVTTLGGADDDIRTAVYSGGSWTTKTDVITNSAGGITGAKITTDSSGAVYAIYTVQTTANTVNTANVYWKKSVDGMTTWSAESDPINTMGSDDIYGAKVAPYSPGRVFVNWYENTEASFYGETIALNDTTAPSSANYKLDAYGFGAGGNENMSSTSYGLFGMLGEVNGSQTTTVVAKDQFTRSVADGLGSADIGGAYTLTGTAADFDVTGSIATISVTAAAQQKEAKLASVSIQNTDAKIKFKTDKIPSGGDEMVFLKARNNGSADNYRARVRLSGGNVYVRGEYFLTSGGTTTSIGSEVQVSGLAFSANTYYWVRAQFFGTNPTTIKIKAWAEGQTEPSTWTYSQTDSTASLQASGNVSFLSRLETGSSNAPVLFTFDDYLVFTENSLNSGLLYTLQSNVPNAPIVANPSNYYNKLNVVINTSDNPSDTKYSIAVSTDNFASNIQYVQNDNAVGSALGLEDWQTYTQWGGTSGVNVLGLSPGTTYSFKVAAKQGNFTETGSGPSAEGITANPALSFDIDIGATSAVDNSAPYSLDIGTLTPGSVVTSSNRIWLDLDTNGAAGLMVYINGANNGLQSTSQGYVINSVSGDLSNVGILEGYGARNYQIGQTTGGPLQNVSPYNGAGDIVGTIDSSKRIIFDSNSQPITGGRAGIELKAKSYSVTKAATDYSDTLTIVVAASF